VAPIWHRETNAAQSRAALGAYSGRPVAGQVTPSHRDGFDSIACGRPEHHSDPSAAAPGAPQPLRQPRKREVPPAGADERLQVKRRPEAAIALVLHALAAVIKAAHVNAPAVIPRFSDGLDRHENKLGTSERVCNSLGST